jgi:rSAM/selenodomain-associated transferase 1
MSSRNDTDMSQLHAKPAAVAIFAKAPIEGLAKTRLIPLLGAKGAADLQGRMIERTARIACAAAIGPVSLWCAPDCQHGCFTEIGRRQGIVLHEQIDDELGARMHHAISTLPKPVLVMGTDCVVIEPEHLRWCARHLHQGSDGVVVPVEDGGYIAIGLNRPSPELFAPMPWGTSLVIAETRRRALASGISLAELEPLWDIDRPEDYERAVREGAL